MIRPEVGSCGVLIRSALHDRRSAEFSGFVRNFDLPSSQRPDMNLIYD